MSDQDEPGAHLHEQFARIGKAVSSPRRIELLQILCQGERSVETLAKATGMSMANASGHLRVLRESGLVETRKEGTRVFYRIADDDVARFYIRLRDLARTRLAEVELLLSRYRESGPEDAPIISQDELYELLDGNDVVVIDVRPTEEYEATHIWKARSIPLDDLDGRIDRLPDDRPVVVYSRGAFCPLSDEAADRMRAAGVRVSRLEVGLPEWRLAGLPIAVGADEGTPLGAAHDRDENGSTAQHA